MSDKIRHFGSFIIAFAMCCFVIGIGVAFSADLGGPKVVKVEPAPPAPDPLAGCWGEASVAGQFAAAGEREASGALGVGCTMKAGVLVWGGGVRYGMGNSINSGEIFARLPGIALNKNLDFYPTIVWQTPNFSAMNTGQLLIGAGLETTIFKEGILGFIEATDSIAKIGSSKAVSKDDLTFRVGTRILVK